MAVCTMSDFIQVALKSFFLQIFPSLMCFCLDFWMTGSKANTSEKLLEICSVN